jgi:chemotaxis protein methyltransferase CheR
MALRIQPEEMRVLSQYVRTISGIHLEESKAYLVESRLGPLASECGCATFSELYFKAKIDSTKVFQRRIIDLITTGETSFFRDTAPFEMLKHKILPDFIDRQARTNAGRQPINLRIWSAACSSGQEVYTIAIVLKELLGDASGYNIRLIGTDLSDRAIANASRGEYNKIEIERGLSPERLNRYFTSTPSGWKVRDELRAMTTFRTANLMTDVSSVGRFDVIFCRNVAIYFTETDRAAVFRRIGRQLDPGGCLIIGSTESLTGLCPEFEPQRHLCSVFYRLKAG